MLTVRVVARRRRGALGRPALHQRHRVGRRAHRDLGEANDVHVAARVRAQHHGLALGQQVQVQVALVLEVAHQHLKT